MRTLRRRELAGKDFPSASSSFLPVCLPLSACEWGRERARVITAHTCVNYAGSLNITMEGGRKPVPVHCLAEAEGQSREPHSQIAARIAPDNWREIKHSRPIKIVDHCKAHRNSQGNLYQSLRIFCTLSLCITLKYSQMFSTTLVMH